MHDRRTARCREEARSSLRNYSLLGARTLLGASGIATSNRKLLEAPGLKKQGALCSMEGIVKFSGVASVRAGNKAKTSMRDLRR